MKKTDNMRFYLFVITLIGLIFVFSSSAVFSYYKYYSKYFMFTKQLLFFIIGWILFFTIVKFKKLVSDPFLIYLFLFTIIFLLLMVEFKGSEINNATRWLKIGPLTIQPSEFFKIIIPMLFAFSLDKQGKIIVKNRNGLNWKVIFNFFIIALGTFLIFIEPDFGTTILILTILFIGLFISRTRFKYIILMFAIIVSLLFLATITSNYRLNRFRAILSPTKGEQTIRYQIIQSQKAIRTGGILGKGLGKSNQKIFYLPEAWSDFIFAVISEEIGGIGTLLLLLLYFLLYWNIYKIGITCKDMRLRYFVILFFILCSIQTCLNIGVAIGALPPTGTVLPLISQGGSSFTAFMIGFGICESVRLKDG